MRAKERALATLESEDSGLTRWKRVADLWCSGWFRDERSRATLRVTFQALVDAVLDTGPALPESVAAPLLREARDIAEAHHFFHWQLEFPEVYYDAAGEPLARPGFDAVLGNPPWEMLRGDQGNRRSRNDARLAAGRVSDFVRGSGVYGLQGDGHVNLYQLFVERSLSFVRENGRLGLILPSGFATDYGCGRLRRAFLDRARIDTFQGFENRERLFPIHRSLKFLLLTATSGPSTTSVPARFGLRRAETLDTLPDAGTDPEAIPLTRVFLDRSSGPLTVVPEVRTRLDLEIAAAVVFGAPPLAHPDGWHVTFGRELNATDDSRHFVEGGPGVPVIDGKHIQPFVVRHTEARYRVPAKIADTLAGGRVPHRRARLAYRDVASATNRLTLIAAIVPAGVLTTHTLFCVKEPPDEESQLFLCGMLNSFVANYLVRLEVGTHVSASLVARLPVPRPSRGSREFTTIVSSARVLAATPGEVSAAAALQACAARLYGLDARHLQHILDSFPLVLRSERETVLSTFHGIVTSSGSSVGLAQRSTPT